MGAHARTIAGASIWAVCSASRRTGWATCRGAGWPAPDRPVTRTAYDHAVGEDVQQGSHVPLESSGHWLRDGDVMRYDRDLCDNDPDRPRHLGPLDPSHAPRTDRQP